MLKRLTVRAKLREKLSICMFCMHEIQWKYEDVWKLVRQIENYDSGR